MKRTMDEKGVLISCPKCGKNNHVPFERLGDTGECGMCHAELPGLDAPVEVASAEQFEALTRAARVPVLVDFWAPWCGPCRMVAPELEKVASRSGGKLVVVKVNTDALPDLAGRFNIYSIPTMSVISGGREVARTSGARPAAAIEAWVRQAASDLASV